MKLFKKASVFMLCLALMLSCVGFTTMAASTVTVSLDADSAFAGAALCVPVKVSAGSNLISGAFCIEYDNSVFTYKGYTAGDISELSQVYADNVVVGSNAVGVIFSTENDAVSVTEAGTIINLNFDVNRKAVGTSALTFNLVRPDDILTKGGIADTNGMIDAAYQDASVRISSSDFDNARISYSVSYDGASYSTPVSVNQLPTKNFETQIVPFERYGDFIYIKYEVSAEDVKSEKVVLQSSECQIELEVNNGIAEIPTYLLSNDDFLPTTVRFLLTLGMNTTSTNDDKTEIFDIISGEVEGDYPYVYDYTAVESGTTLAADGATVEYDTNYSVDVCYSKSFGGKFTKTKFWVADGKSYDYNFSSGTLTAEGISAKQTSADVTFEVYPPNATVSFDYRDVTAVNGYATFEDVMFGISEYTVSANGYVSQSGSVNVIPGMDNIPIELEQNSVAEVTFYVNEDDAEVTFNNETSVVLDGQTVFSDVEFGTYDYTVTLDGYQPVSGSVEVDKSVVDVNVELVKLKTTETVTFNVTPNNATVQLGTVAKTATNGTVSFEDVSYGQYAYSVSATGYVTKQGNVTVEDAMSPVVVVLDPVTTTDVVFNVTPADASVTFNGETIAAVEGVATFEDVEYGTLSYSVSKAGYVTKTGDVTVEKGVEPVVVVLEEEQEEEKPVPVLTGLRTYDQKYNEETGVITVRALDTQASAGIAITIDGVADSDKTADAGISVGVSGGYKYFVVKKADGLSRTFNIYVNKGGKKYTYVVNFSFIDEALTLVNFEDVITLRAYRASVNVNTKEIYVDVDNYSVLAQAASIGALVIPPKGVTATYTFDHANNDAFTGFSVGATDGYTSYKTGVSTEGVGGGEYGKQTLKIFRTNTGATRIYTNVVLDDGEKQTTWTLLVRLMDISVEDTDGSVVKIEKIAPLRANADTIEFDNKAGTIFFETTTENSSAGFAVDVSNTLTEAQRPRKIITPESGKQLAIGDCPATGEVNKRNFERYVVARLAVGTKQHFKVKIYDGEDGLTYRWYDVTCLFHRAYEGDIEFADMLSMNADKVEFDDNTNTYDVEYTKVNCFLAPVLIQGAGLRIRGDHFGVGVVNGKRAYGVNKANGVDQVIYFEVSVINDITTYTVNFHYTGE